MADAFGFTGIWDDALDFVKTHYFVTAILAATGGYWILRKIYSPGICRCTTRLDGKTVIITGANTGLGQETALNLAGRGARVILACRDVVKAKAAAEMVQQKTGSECLVVQQLDLSSFKSIRNFVEKIYQTEDRLDVLMNNAGVMACPKMRTEDGFEMHFAVNHLGHFLLTNLLLDLLKKTPGSRVINVTSFVHKGSSMKWDDLNHDRNYLPIRSYTQSKLANILFTKALSKRLRGTGVTTYAVNPGIVKTALDRHLRTSWWTSILVNIAFDLVCKTPVQGCQTQVHCAISPEIADESGCYYSDCKEVKPAKQACVESDAEKLWTLSLQMTGLKHEGMPDVVPTSRF